jgi:hypothetical protein
MARKSAASRQFGALLALVDDVQRYFMLELEGGIAAHRSHPESWAFVGMDPERALALLVFARDKLATHPSPAFLDCGAGLGFVGMMARGLGFRPSGIEFCQRYVELANRLLPWSGVVEGNVLDHPDYGEPEVIYYYGPFKDEALQERFELKVEADAKPGAIIIANRKVSDAWTRSSRFEVLLEVGTGGWIFRKLG